jgi:hypothetical protein
MPISFSTEHFMTDKTGVISAAKLGTKSRCFWVVLPPYDDGALPGHSIAEGFASNINAAWSAAEDAAREAGIASPRRASILDAADFYQTHRARQVEAKSATFDGSPYLWTVYTGWDDWGTAFANWTKHIIVKVTAKSVFALSHGSHMGQPDPKRDPMWEKSCVVPRADLERDGYAQTSHDTLSA